MHCYRMEWFIVIDIWALIRLKFDINFEIVAQNQRWMQSYGWFDDLNR